MLSVICPNKTRKFAKYVDFSLYFDENDRSIFMKYEFKN